MKRFCGILIVMLAVLLNGCTPQPSDGMMVQQKSYTLGIVLKSMNSQHWRDIRSGILDAARELGIATIILYPENETSVREQKAMFIDVLKAKPDAIIWAPCDSTDCKAFVDQAAQVSIPVYALDTRPEDIALPYIGANNQYIGKLAAEQMIQLTGGKGEIAIISGSIMQSSHTERISGFFSALKGTELTVVAIENANSDYRMSMEKMKTLINRYPNLTGVFCTSAVMGLGAIEQSRSLYVKAPFFVAVDTQDDALMAVQNGTLQGLVTQSGYEAGYKAVMAVEGDLRGKTIERDTFIKSELVTRDNVTVYLRSYLQQEGIQ